MALPTEPDLPLADLKILDFSWVGVGPITVKYLADHGATVVRVESHARLDVVRLGPPWHDAKPGIERSQFYASYHTSKYGIALDLGRPDAREIERSAAAVATRNGNRAEHAAPHGVYPCAGEGADPDRWIAVSVRGTAEWRAFCAVLGRPEWGEDPRFATHADRVAAADALDTLITEATRR